MAAYEVCDGKLSNMHFFFNLFFCRGPSVLQLMSVQVKITRMEQLISLFIKESRDNIAGEPVFYTVPWSRASCCVFTSLPFSSLPASVGREICAPHQEDCGAEPRHE